jgi:hypothetical protein
VAARSLKVVAPRREGEVADGRRAVEGPVRAGGRCRRRPLTVMSPV